MSCADDRQSLKKYIEFTKGIFLLRTRHDNNLLVAFLLLQPVAQSVAQNM